MCGLSVLYTSLYGYRRSFRKKKTILLQRRPHGYTRTTNHWPHNPTAFPEKPRFFKKDAIAIRPLPSPVVNPDQLYLAVF